MMATSPTIADTMLQTRRGLIDHFTSAGATSADAALTYQPQRHAERRALSYLMSRQIVRMTQEGRHWLDEAAAQQWRRENRTRTAWMIGGALAAVAGLVAIRSYRARSAERPAGEDRE
jgi:glucuronate isomerase